MINLAKPSLSKFSNSMCKKIFNSCPLEFSGVPIEGIKQVSYTNYQVSSSESLSSLLGKLQNSNPKLKFVNSSIIGDRFYDNEESALIKKPEKDVWQLNDLGNGVYSISLS